MRNFTLLGLVAVVLVMGITFRWSGLNADAQGDSQSIDSTVAALETRVALQETLVADLQGRVRILELASGETEPTAAPTSTVEAGHSITGYVTSLLSPNDSIDTEDDGSCSLLNVGSGVVVKDGAGNVIGTGSLGQGRLVERPLSENDDLIVSFCDEAFEIRNVPTADFYVFVLDSVDGEITMTRAELEATGWEAVIFVS